MVWAFRIGQDRDRPCCRTWGRLRWRACRRVLSLPLWCWCFWAFRLVWAEYAVCRWESRASGGHKARQRVYPAWEYCPVKDCRAEYRRQICRRRGRYPVRRALSVGRVQLRSRCRCFFLRIRCFLRFCLKINTPEIHWILGVFFACFCDPAGIRTQDPNIKSVVLYRLSYWIGPQCFSIAGANIGSFSLVTKNGCCFFWIFLYAFV